MITLAMITIDSTDARALAAWWAERLGGEVVSENDGYFCVVQAPALPLALGVQLVSQPTPGKNRLHLDFNREANDSRDDVIAEWVGAGATHVSRNGESGSSWDVFADPHGNLFCIGDPH